LSFAESFFGAHVRISMVSGIVNGSGIPRGALHSDWPYNQKSAAHVLAPYPDALMHIVTMWMLSDFTPENGGTIVVPGSHKKPCHPLDDASMSPWPGETQLTGKAGAVAAFDARLWHAVAENRTNADRVAVLVRYAPGGSTSTRFARGRWIITISSRPTTAKTRWFRPCLGKPLRISRKR